MAQAVASNRRRPGPDGRRARSGRPEGGSCERAGRRAAHRWRRRRRLRCRRARKTKRNAALPKYAEALLRMPATEVRPLGAAGFSLTPSAETGAAMAVFANSGQICSAGTRPSSSRRSTKSSPEKVARFAKTLKVGNGAIPRPRSVRSSRPSRSTGSRPISASAGRRAPRACRAASSYRGRLQQGLLRAAHDLPNVRDDMRTPRRRSSGRSSRRSLHRHRSHPARQCHDLRPGQRRGPATSAAPGWPRPSAPVGGVNCYQAWTRPCRSAATR